MNENAFVYTVLGLRNILISQSLNGQSYGY